MKTYRKPNNTIIYKQYDSRWGYLPYPVLPSTLASSGCGCCSVTHCLLEIDSSKTPKDTQPFMKQYAARGHGTYWTGITEGLKHYGFKNVKQHTLITDLWTELEKGNRIGVLLFNNNKSPDGHIFTSGGHYIAFLGYKKSDDGKKHYLYLKDSGGRNNSGWLCFETSMRNCVRHIWSCEVPEGVIVLPSRGYFKYGDSGESVKIIQRFLKKQGLYSGKIGGHYKSRTRAAVKAFQKKHKLTVDGLWGKECMTVYNKLK